VSSAGPDPGRASKRGAGTVGGALEVLAARAGRILARPLAATELERFDKYLSLLNKWQRIHRLVGSVEPEWVVEHLFLDSLLFLRVLPENLRSLADLGSGAGFPGIPINIVRPGVEVTLIESRQRRVSFLSTVARELGLERIRVAGGRAEDGTGPFEAVAMRCAGNPEHLLESARALVGPGGVVVVSGPPERRPISGGRWVEVEGVRPGSTRLFAVYPV
jgi:16S rRNA (guanine527-N7)-methyltransferase